jgi:hypothetical protein
VVDPELEAEFGRVLGKWQSLGHTLAELAERLAIETIVDVLPGASAVEVHGEFNEDWLRTLRVRRVLSADGTVLSDVEQGHEDRRVEAAIDNVNTEYLDLLLDPTGDSYMGESLLESSMSRTFRHPAP